MRSSMIISLILFAGMAANAFADETFTSSVQVRHRFESDWRDFDKDTNPLTFSLLRSRVNLRYTGLDNISAFVQLQDSRTWGEEVNTLLDGSADRFDMHQGYILAEKLFADPLKMKLGRMEVNYGSQRLIGAVDWHNIGRSFDGVIFTVSSSRFTPDFFYFAEAESLHAGDRGDLSIFGINADVVTTDKYKTEVFAYWQRNVPTRILNRATVGFYANGNHGPWGHETEGAYQLGNITPREIYPGSVFTGDSVRVDVTAFMLTLNLWYAFNDVAWKPRITAGAELLSGTKAGGAEGAKFKSFDTLYATNHKFYGYMDFFINIPANTFGRGLVDYHGKLDAASGKNAGRAAFHVFQSHEDFILGSGSTSKSFGSELDLTFKHKYADQLSFILGASAFWPGDIFKETKGGDTAWWAYIMTTLDV